MTLENTIKELCSKVRQSSKPLARAGTETRTQILLTLARTIEENRQEIVEANAEDLARGQSSGLSAAMMDRLKLMKIVSSSLRHPFARLPISRPRR